MPADRKRILKLVLIYSVCTVVAVFWGTVLAACWLYIQLCLYPPQIEPQIISSNDAPDALKILFIGNSLTYQNMLPAVFESMVESGLHKKAKLRQVTFPGYSLQKQWNRSETIAAIEKGAPWDMVIVQPQSEEGMRDCNALFDYAGRFNAKIHATGAKTIFFQTWADKGQDKTQQQITKAYDRLGEQLAAPVVPVGDCWFTCQRQDPGLDLYGFDGHHPAPAGTYLTACELYAYLLGKDPHGLPPKAVLQIGQTSRTFVNLTQSQAAHLQDLAWTYYKAHPVKGLPAGKD